MDGSRVQRKQIIGNTDQYKDKSAAKAAAVNLRERVNADNVNQGRKKLRQLWGHFQVFELGLRKDQRDLHAGEFAAADEPIDQTSPDDFPDGDEKRSPTTVQLYLDNFRLYILPKWGEFFIDEVKAPAVEYWLKNLMGQEKITARGRERKKLSPSSKSKLRNQMSALYSHALRHEWCTGINPIKAVRQSSKRQKTPDFLTLSEMKGILDNISDALRKTAVLVAAVTGFRRSEVRGLRWSDIDFENLWIYPRVGVVRGHTTKLKTEASRNGIPIRQELAEVLLNWRRQCLYPLDTDWVFASPDEQGEFPVWLETVLPNYIQPAAKKAGIKKTVGWHTFRRSLGSILAPR